MPPAHVQYAFSNHPNFQTSNTLRQPDLSTFRDKISHKILFLRIDFYLIPITIIILNLLQLWLFGKRTQTVTSPTV